MEVPESVMCPVWQSTNESLQITDSPLLSGWHLSETVSLRLWRGTSASCILNPTSLQLFSHVIFVAQSFQALDTYITQDIYIITHTYHIISYIYMYVHYYVYNVYQCISCTTSCSLSICMCQVSIYFYICMHISFLVLSFFCGKQTFSARYLWHCTGAQSRDFE
jgi:hypothetical protein